MQQMNFNVYLTDRGNSGYLNLFSARDYESSRTIISVKNPLKIGTIDKYFKTEEDLPIIKQSLLDVPEIFTFDQAASEDS